MEVTSRSLTIWRVTENTQWAPPNFFFFCCWGGPVWSSFLCVCASLHASVWVTACKLVMWRSPSKADERGSSVWALIGAIRAPCVHVCVCVWSITMEQPFAVLNGGNQWGMFVKWHVFRDLFLMFALLPHFFLSLLQSLQWKAHFFYSRSWNGALFLHSVGVGIVQLLLSVTQQKM